MASIHTRVNSTSQQISVVIGDRRVAKSLHTTDAALASRIGAAFDAIESALARDKKARQATLLGLVEELLIAADVPIPWDQSGRSMPVLTVFESYLDRRRGKVTPAALRVIESTLTGFAAFVSNKDIKDITAAHVEGWLSGLMDSLSAATASNRLIALRAAFAHSIAIGLLTANPAMDVEVSPSDETSRLPISDGDFSKLTTYLENQNEDSWLIACMIARYTGLRLGDVMSLAAENIGHDGDALYIDCITSKAKKYVIVPAFGGLREFLSSITFEPKAKLCGKLSERTVQSLSATFTAILESAGIDTMERRLGNGRTQRLIGFHSLRHSFVSWLATAGVPEDLRCLLAGHTKRAHRGYVHQTASMLAQRMGKHLTSGQSGDPSH